MDGIHILFIILAVVIAPFIVMVIGRASKVAKQKQTDKQVSQAFSSHSAKSEQSGLTDEQRQRLNNLREYYKDRIAAEEQEKQQLEAEKHERHVEDAHEHAHLGEEEHYEEIVGSLGDVNDEGCEDLNGVRFIAYDVAYDTNVDGEHDYTELAKVMVLGDIINTPRCRAPYTRKR